MTKPTITLTENDDGWWTVRNHEIGVTTQGRTREEALENLDEAVAGVQGEGREPTDEELREIGIDPEDNRSGRGDLPEFMQSTDGRARFCSRRCHPSTGERR